MTIKQAINIMRLWEASAELNGAKGDVVEAMNMAIEALEKQAKLEELMNIDSEIVDRWC